QGQHRGRARPSRMALSLPLVALPGGALESGAARTAVSVWYAFGLNSCFTDLAKAVHRRGTGGYASAYAVYNIASGAGMIGSNAAAGYLTAHVSFLAASLAASAIMPLSVPVLLLGRPRAVPGTVKRPLPNGPREPGGDSRDPATNGRRPGP